MSSQGGSTAVMGKGHHRAHIQTLVREGSLYNLTLSEVESHLGAPLLSMNLDDLVRSVLPDDTSLPIRNGVGNSGSQNTPSSGLERQGSSITVPPALSKKTVDEVWRDIQQDQESSDDEERSSGCEAQLSFGEMTLEEFLHRVGIVSEQHQKDADELSGRVGTGEDSNLMTKVQDFPQGTSPIDAFIIRQSIAQPLSVAIPSTMDAIYPDGQMSISPSVALSDLQTPTRKRISSEDVVYKVVDRRQKRMIKNRESAARSRARKQAYTNELECKLSCLEEENKRLKREKELDRLLKSAPPPPEPKPLLRRARSASF
ncbi:ABSCISIC ACID-INSENSITIVE 5-like protein 2 [Brachypodium distachyon]|uniref:BZIP domain-containing protein n=2 Tax=Brachypodium distachyon TaxID=15368 RepID=I1IUU3_BRADI|nr:ABSCISIC ACID-INSENSITIVE 5-like protein 2 [Brachypodium distachyon]XP_010238783.1 ABSCISIC ACID-INSENSITIVE 5-like protein 2 [Brachypodium distachyon]KQJ92469.1 hypothetical protein BRADI_4g43850v3 [Brachypodium distachyon]KQJ92470.1 hypothetical protein BRADI_4g43850v3 [Brachypodium distachyon]|eukprot:XP_003578996.1 ABSCISIC ACID-INSENSITIVE 5-like protein 2 [Brachypodium distachyon]